MLRIEDRIPIARVPALLGKSLPTVYRWFKTGVNGVKLRTERVGCQRYTCSVWLEDFVQQLSAMSLPSATREEEAHVA